MKSERAARLRGLYAVTPEIEDTKALCAGVARSLAGGASLVQYRAKSREEAKAVEQAQALAALCRGAGALFIVNDSIELAQACAADGVHLGRDDAQVAYARRRLRGAIIGASCYDDPSRAAAAARDGADYVAVGSMFSSPTKPAARRAPLEAIGEAARASGLPVAAIGGIDLSNAGRVVDAGADMIAVVSALFEAPDIERAARAFANLFSSSPSTRAPTQPRAL